MANELDGFKVLRRIGKHAAEFSDVAVDARKAARSLVAKQLKAKSTTLQTLCKIHEIVGGKAFIFLVEGLSDADVTALVSKFDPHHPELKAANPAWRRARLAALASGKVEPATTSPAPPKTTLRTSAKTSAAKPPERLDSLAMAAVRKGR
jgi:hypothetical protein